MPFIESQHFRQGAAHADNIAATVASLSSFGRRERLDLVTDETWQQKVRIADRDGPGIVGASLDMPAATSMLLDLCIRRRTARGYEIVKDQPGLTALLQMWRAETMDQRHLFSRLIRTLDGVAECYLVLHNADGARNGRVHWQLAQTTQATDNRDGTTTLRGTPHARNGDKHYATVQNRWVYHAMNSDLEWDGRPWSPMRRAIPHVEQYKAAMRVISRNLDSQLAMNGILWAEAVGEGTKWPDAVTAWAEHAIRSDEGVQTVAPYMMATKSEPKWIDVGRGDHADQIEVADLFLKAFAQSTDLPTQMLLEGPGQGNHWNAYLEGDFYADMTMAPRWQRACAVITETHLRPFMRGLPASFRHLNPDDYEVWADDTRIRTKTDNTERILRSREMGVATREAVADAVGLNPDDIMELPEGTTEFEAWLVAKGGASTAAAAVIQQDLEEDLRDVAESEGLDVAEPDLDASRRRLARTLENPPPEPGEVAAAAIEVEGELKSRKRPDYWFTDLVPPTRKAS